MCISDPFAPANASWGWEARALRELDRAAALAGANLV
jgi:hypothetical protein